MKRHATWVVTGVLLLACSTAGAIPPPWLLEGEKAKADLILVAAMGKSQAMKPAPGVNARIDFKPVQILKGKIDQKDGEEPKLFLLHYRPPAPVGPLRPVAVGGTGYAKPADGESALIFLRKDKKDGEFRVVCGSFGYVGLKIGTTKDLAATRKRIAGYRLWCERIVDPKIRKAMEGHYQKTLVFVDEQVKKTKEGKK